MSHNSLFLPYALQEIFRNYNFAHPKIFKPPPIKALLWFPVKSEKKQILTKMSCLTFCHYINLFSMLGAHVPLWEGSIALGETFSALGRLLLWERHIPLWEGSIPLGETHAPLGWLYPSGRALSIWKGPIP